MKSFAGHFLVASKEMTDPNFHQTVVLIIQHSEEGAMGVVINRPTPTTVQDAWKKITGSTCPDHGRMHIGGPCEGNLSVVHTAALHADLTVLDELFFSANKDSIEQVVQSPSIECRFFVGYAGWGPGQLESELDRNDWLLLPAKNDLTFSDDDELWELLVKKSTGHSILEALNVKHVPKDVGLN